MTQKHASKRRRKTKAASQQQIKAALQQKTQETMSLQIATRVMRKALDHLEDFCDEGSNPVIRKSDQDGGWMIAYFGEER